MIKILKEFDFATIYPLLEDQNFIMCHPEKIEKVSAIIKQWIAIILDKYYYKDPKKMIETKKHFFRFVGNSLLNNDEIILITKKYEKDS